MQPLLGDLAHAPDFRNGQRSQGFNFVGFCDYRQPIRLVQIGRQFRQKLVGGNANRSGESGLGVDLHADSRLRVGYADGPRDVFGLGCLDPYAGAVSQSILLDT